VHGEPVRGRQLEPRHLPDEVTAEAPGRDDPGRGRLVQGGQHGGRIPAGDGRDRGRVDRRTQHRRRPQHVPAGGRQIMETNADGIPHRIRQHTGLGADNPGQLAHVERIAMAAPADRRRQLGRDLAAGDHGESYQAGRAGRRESSLIKRVHPVLGGR
jgi:hypothetical protein